MDGDEKSKQLADAYLALWRLQIQRTVLQDPIEMLNAMREQLRNRSVSDTPKVNAFDIKSED